MTRSTKAFARVRGVAPFLPALFVERYGQMGGLDRAAFGSQLRELRTFTDAGWAGYWMAIADGYIDEAQQCLVAISRFSGGSVPSLRAVNVAAPPDFLRAELGPAAPMFAVHGPQSQSQALGRLVAASRPKSDVAAFKRGEALDLIIKAITYLQIAAFPGGTPERMNAYARSRELSDALAGALAPALGWEFAPLSVPVDGDEVQAYSLFPAGDEPVAAVVMTNGLEGTVQELLLPLLRRAAGETAFVVMEMPGVYAYRRPMGDESEQIYDRVINAVADLPRVDEGCIGMLGVSFGGYWAARMAAAHPLLRAAVCCGAPTDRSFGPGGSLGVPQIILDTLAQVTGSRTPLGAGRRLQRLSLRGRYHAIFIPLLAINGDHDTLVKTQDTIDLASQAPKGELVLYPNDDHCAIKYSEEWMELAHNWLGTQLAPRDLEATR